MTKFLLYFHTLKYLKWTQIRFRIYYMLRSRWRRLTGFKYNFQQKAPPSQPLKFQPSIPAPTTWLIENKFRFLNIEHDLGEEIDWNFYDLGKLWVYNLNYFEFLNQPDFPKEEGLRLIHDFIDKIEKSTHGVEPFPIALRTIFWIKFLRKHDIQDAKIDDSLYSQIKVLEDNLEKHLLGNHLWENSFALFFGAFYFGDKGLLKTANQILKSESEEQILADGAHFELTPMYHQIMLFRMLDCFNLAQNQDIPNFQNLEYLKSLPKFLAQKTAKMLAWLKAITYQNDNIPLLNDSAYGIAPTTKELLDYAKQLNIDIPNTPLKDSGYRKINHNNFELIVDVGHIGPSYIPGHAHSDTFNFELVVGNQHFITDTGISTYDKNDRRNLERATESHNTVQIESLEQTEVWGGFRVARRAEILNLEEKENSIKAAHSGYQRIGIIHERKFEWSEKEILIEDNLKGKSKVAKAYFHFHPNINLKIDGNEVTSSTQEKVSSHKQNFQMTPPPSITIGTEMSPEILATLHFENFDKIEIQEYQFAPRWYTLIPAKKLVVTFSQNLCTKIKIK